MKDLEQKVKLSELVLNWFNLTKNVIFLILGVMLFCFVQRPESLVNRQASEETVARERAKLVLELIKEDDSAKAALGLEVIKAAYPNDNSEWLQRVEQIVKAEPIDGLEDEYRERLTAYERGKQELEDAKVRGEQGLHPEMLQRVVIASKKRLEITASRLKEYGTPEE